MKSLTQFIRENEQENETGWGLFTYQVDGVTNDEWEKWHKDNEDKLEILHYTHENMYMVYDHNLKWKESNIGQYYYGNGHQTLYFMNEKYFKTLTKDKEVVKVKK